MNTPLRTNEIKYSLNYDRLSQIYEVFKVTTTDKYFSSGSYMFDSPLLCDNVCSLMYESGKSIYVLMNKEVGNKKKLRDTLASLSDFSSVTISLETISSVPQYLMLQLLLNNLGTYSRSLKVSNLTGHLYCFHPKWVKHSKESDKSFISRVPTLEVRISSDYKFILSVRTFTSVKLKRYIKFGKKRFESYPQYVFSAQNTLRRKLKTDTDAGFILRQTDGDRTEISFLNLKSYDEFNKTKMGVLCEILNSFNAKYEGLSKIELQTIDDYNSVNVKSSLKMLKEIKPIVRSYLLEKGIKVVDLIGDEYSKKCCQKIGDILKAEYNVDVRKGARIDKTALNICLIHNTEYYERYGLNDPHRKVYDGIAIQHITFEDFNFDAVCTIRTVVQELLIKCDLTKNKICLYDWASLGLDGNIAFMTSYIGANEVQQYFCMEIASDGTFSISEKQLDLFECREYADCVEIFEIDNAEKNVRGVVKLSDGNINIIRDSMLFAIPELDAIRSKLQAGDTYLRNREARDSMLTAILDIKGYYKNHNMYYFAGIIGEGMQAKVDCAVNIREIHPYNQSKLFFEHLLPLMNVIFIRNGQLTVVPFPFKYLSEYIKLQENSMQKYHISK